jgi:hypothetical protein
VEGGSVTFVFRGEADGVNLRHWVFGLESSNALARLPNTDLWYLTLEIPPKSRVEYKYEVHRGGHSVWIEDPLNPNRARDPFGANSVLQARATRCPRGRHHDPALAPRPHRALHLRQPSLRRRRRGHLYLPARFRRTRQYPLLVVHDGSDYLKYAA